MEGLGAIRKILFFPGLRIANFSVLCYNCGMKPAGVKYTAIRDTLKREILDGKYLERERFPSEEALHRRFGASRPTIERALRELKLEGLLSSRAGSGSFLTFAALSATGAIGVIAPDYRRIEFFTGLCDAIAAVARRNSYDVLLGDVSAPEAVSDRGAWAIALAQAYARRRIAGVLLEPVDLIPDSCEATEKVLAVFDGMKIPVVLLDRDYLPFPARSAYDLVGIDNVQAGYRIARHLIEGGARRLRFITHPDYANTIRARIQGVALAALDSGLEWKNEFVLECEEPDAAFARKIMKGAASPDAFVCRNDPTAAKLIQAMAQNGIAVPERVRVASFDDSSIARLVNPPLTTIRQPVQTMAETAVASLLQRIRDSSLAPRAILLDAPLIVRTSALKRGRAEVGSRK